MEATDLMIGDWVNFLTDIEGGDTEYDPCTDQYQPMRIDRIFSFGEVDSDLGVINDASQLQPIPLTAEILEKNFPLIRDGVYWSEYASSDRFDIRIEYNDLYVEGIFTFVHELQHALRLCGIDKNIVL